MEDGFAKPDLIVPSAQLLTYRPRLSKCLFWEEVRSKIERGPASVSSFSIPAIQRVRYNRTSPIPKEPRMDTQTLPPIGRGMVLEDVDWKTYSRLLKAFEERPGIRLTYDRGALEIMPLLEHDIDGRFLGRIIIALTEELGLPILCGGSTTLRRQLHQRGIESDECYWIANEPRMRGRRALNLQRDPPPDLAVEVDVTSSSLDRLDIYATLGVPEIWRLE